MKQNFKFKKLSFTHVVQWHPCIFLHKYGHPQGFNAEETGEFAYKLTLNPCPNIFTNCSTVLGLEAYLYMYLQALVLIFDIFLSSTNIDFF
jgi:hypothetical protein